MAMLSLIAGTLALERYHCSRGISGIKSRHVASVPFLPEFPGSRAPRSPGLEIVFLYLKLRIHPTVPLASYTQPS